MVEIERQNNTSGLSILSGIDPSNVLDRRIFESRSSILVIFVTVTNPTHIHDVSHDTETVQSARYSVPADGSPLHLTILETQTIEDSYTKYKLCRVRSNNVKLDEMYASKQVAGSDRDQNRFRSKPVFLDLDVREKYILETSYPEDGAYHTCLTRWTLMTRESIDDIEDSLMKDFVYTIL